MNVKCNIGHQPQKNDANFGKRKRYIFAGGAGAFLLLSWALFTWSVLRKGAGGI
jgi:hypothetical protein